MAGVAVAKDAFDANNGMMIETFEVTQDSADTTVITPARIKAIKFVTVEPGSALAAAEIFDVFADYVIGGATVTITTAAGTLSGALFRVAIHGTPA